MAVIRAAQLWIGPVPPNVEVSTMPVDPPDALQTPEVSPRAVHLYTCPQGYKAIVRTMTFTLDQTQQSGTGPTMAIWLRPTGQSVEWKVFWYWWMEWASGGQLTFRYHFTWNGQLVLKAGDQLRAAHSAVGDMHTMGSGHELPIQA